jgi:hypothetical protein
MSIFDLLFIGAFVATLAMTAMAGIALVRRRRAQAVTGLRRLGLFLGGYLGIVIAVSLASPRRVVPMGEDQCFDDWCIAVVKARHLSKNDSQTCEVTLRVSSRARRVTQRERDVRVYLLDGRGTRYDPIADPAADRFDIPLKPQEAANATRSFELPADARDLFLVVSHEGWFPSAFIIGDSESLFHKPTVVRLE